MRTLSLLLALSLSACGDDGSTPRIDAMAGNPDAANPGADAGNEPDGGGNPSTTYEFESRFVAGESSVAYNGQTFRQVLITDLTKYIDNLTAQIDGGDATLPGEVVTALDFYYRFDPAAGGLEVPLLLTTTPPTLQMVYGDISSGADLRSKMAGQDTVTDHRDWSMEFVGWSGTGGSSPDALVQAWFQELDGLAYQRSFGVIPNDPDGNSIGKVFVTADGRDLKQLLQKFLTMGVTFSQGTDDYLDSATEAKGLLSPNTRDGENRYTTLEHAWDEGFGYFGAARNYADFSLEEIAGSGGRPDWAVYHDASGDGFIDLKQEYNFAASTNAAKRDLGATVATDYAKSTFEAFIRGRQIIAGAGETLTRDEMTALETERNLIVANWERAYAATIVHYINQMIVHIDDFGTPEYNFLDYAKHFSEMKGFALGLQFSPFSPLALNDFETLHELLRDAPVLSNESASNIAAYRADLLAAREIIRAAYGFDPANIGDDNGLGGW